MTRVSLGLLLGLAFGVVDVLLMIPLDLPDKPVAMTGAFFARFALGFFVATIRLPLPPVAAGLVVGLLASLPDAIITGTFLPIIGVGLVLGASGGWIVGRRLQD